VALPMDEQRILEEMERQLAADDPKLAARLAAFGQPGLGHVLRTRRARATLSLMVVVLAAAVASVIYMMSMFRPGTGNYTPAGRPHVTSSVSHTPAGSRPTSTDAALKAPAPQINSLHCAQTVKPACGGWLSAQAGRPNGHPTGRW
jgi:hypothetical protein